MCSRHLHSAASEWLPEIEVDRGAFSKSVHDRLLSISAATIDRILRPYKVTKGKSLTRSGGFRDEIPIQESCWDIKVPVMDHFYPCFKLQDKIRIKRRTRRVYATPVTPYERVMNSQYVSKEEKDKLAAIHGSLDPVKRFQLESKSRQ